MIINKYLQILLLSILLLSNTANSQWTSLNSGTVQNLNSIYFIDVQTGYACGGGGVIIKTSNGGTNWQVLSSGTSAELKSIHFTNGATGYMCGNNGTILKTTNGGINWSTLTGSTSSNLTGISFSNDNSGICSGYSGTMLYTTNGGTNWLIGQPEGYLITFHSAYMVNSLTGYIAGVNTIFSPLVGKTTNGGANWIFSSFYLNSNEGTVRDIHFFDSQNGVAVSNVWNGTGAVSKTTNGGTNWTTQLFTNAFYGVDFPNSATGFTVGFSGNIFKTTDAGINWSQQSSGTSAFLKAVDFIDSLTGYAAGDGGVILKTTNGGVLAIEPVANIVPVEYNLFQNYPNPFNPITNLRFEIPELRFVSLKIYDVLGKEIASLVNEKLSPGIYEAEFDGSNYANGVYYYTLYTEKFIQTKRMVLIK